MSLKDILDQYRNSSTENSNVASDHFDTVAREAPREAVGQGLADAFRADSTPSFGDMVRSMFGQSNPEQRAGVLNQLLRSLGPTAASALGGGILGRTQADATAPSLTPEQAARVPPEQVQDIASRAERHDPTVLDKIGSYYAEHPQLVKTLGSAALAIALAGVANRVRSR